MNPKLLMAALAVVALTVQAEAAKRPPIDRQLAPSIDIAAQPAYPMPGQQRAARSRAMDANGTHARALVQRRGAVRASYGQTGVVRSSKTGATAHVSPRYAGQFQAYVDDLEAGGAEVRFMGGYRKGRCWTGGRHPCGMALDVCQLRRGVVDRRCHLPGPAAIFAVAARHNLFEGAGWGHSDYGHAQAGGNDAAAVRFGGMAQSARSHHRKVRLARR